MATLRRLIYIFTRTSIYCQFQHRIILFPLSTCVSYSQFTSSSSNNWKCPHTRIWRNPLKTDVDITLERIGKKLFFSYLLSTRVCGISVTCSPCVCSLRCSTISQSINIPIHFISLQVRGWQR